MFFRPYKDFCFTSSTVVKCFSFMSGEHKDITGGHIRCVGGGQILSCRFYQKCFAESAMWTGATSWWKKKFFSCQKSTLFFRTLSLNLFKTSNYKFWSLVWSGGTSWAIEETKQHCLEESQVNPLVWLLIHFLVVSITPPITKKIKRPLWVDFESQNKPEVDALFVRLWKGEVYRRSYTSSDEIFWIELNWTELRLAFFFRVSIQKKNLFNSQGSSALTALRSNRPHRLRVFSTLLGLAPLIGSGCRH